MSTVTSADVHERIRPRRRITGLSAVLLPFTEAGAVDWVGFTAHVERTAAAGLTPAVNMDTGYVQLLDAETRAGVLERAQAHSNGGFVAGAHVPDKPSDCFSAEPYLREMDAIAERGGVPVVFPAHGLNALGGPAWAEAHAALARRCDRFIAFELGPMFVPYGRIYDLDAYGALLDIPQCIGAKHSSLDRGAEWDRLALRDARRPDFKVFTGNDLAIDMVMYGSDYLLGLATFAPDCFAARDGMWERGERDFYALNDVLQYLGQFAFRAPVSAYKHNAAQFLKLRGWIASDATPPGAERRPESDAAVLAEIGRQLGVLG